MLNPAGVNTSRRKPIKSSDKSDACFIAIEAGITKVITATYPVMKMLRVSLQWKSELLK